MNHTKEPWSFSPAENGLEWGVEAGKWGVAICADAPGDGTSEANARRIVACVNACAGLPTDTLETIPSWSSAGVKTLADVEKQRDDLLAALEAFTSARVTLPRGEGSWSIGGLYEAEKLALETIASVKSGTQ